MTLTAVKLVRVQIFAPIGKAIAKKNADGRTDERTQLLFIYIDIPEIHKKNSHYFD